MKGFCFSIILFLLPTSCLADNQDASVQDKFKKFLDNPGSYITPYGRPRTVAKGAKPEILIQGDQISINGKIVKIKDHLEKWKAAIPSKPRCDNSPPRILCDWDELGIELLTKSETNTQVVIVHFYFNIEPREPLLVTRWPDGTPAVDTPDLRPKNPFRGYFAIDGYGIDAKTEFWEILAKADPKRNLHCGARDCGFPLGAFSETDALHFRLNKPNVRGNIYELSIAAPYEAPNAKVTKNPAKTGKQ